MATLLFLLPENTASAVIDVFDFLNGTDVLNLAVFQNLFPVISQITVRSSNVLKN